MATDLNTFVAPVRILIDDTDLDVPNHSAAVIEAALALTVNSGEVEGYTLGEGGTLTPDFNLSTAAGQTSYALLIYKTAKLFVQNLSRSTYRTRAFAEVVDVPPHALHEIMEKVYALENDMVG